MTEELLRYYNRELAFFRRMAAEFATANPKIASRLRLGAESSEDPHVERLIEAFAFFNARIRHKLEDDFPEISDAYLNVLYPHYLAPVPSMAIVQFVLDESQTALTSGYTLPRHLQLETEAIQGEPCRFRTTYPVQLWPITVQEASLRGRPIAAPTTPRSSSAAAVLKLRLSSLAEECSFDQLELRRLRFFLKGFPQHTYALYELIFNNTLQIALARSPQDTNPTLLGPECIRPVGFDKDEGMLPYSARSPLAYRLLTEYFAFPEKFLFFELALSEEVLQHYDTELEIYFYLDQTAGDLEQNVSLDTFRLGCTPVVNLFRQRAEPIQLTHTEWEYRVVPDARRPLATEIYSVDQVVAASPTGDEVEYQPFYSVQHASEERDRCFWYTTRRPGEAAGEGDVDHGTELFMSLVDLQFDPSAPADGYVDVEATCLNRDLPNRLPFGGGEPKLFLSEGEGPLSTIECLTAPTPTRRPPRRHAAIWRLISHLSLGQLSIVGGEEGALAFREILKLYDVHDAPQTRAIIDSVLDVDSRRQVARVSGVVCRGTEVAIQFRPEQFSENGLFLFACVLERFLALYCSINSFSQLSAGIKGREAPLKQWGPRAGDKVLL